MIQIDVYASIFDLAPTECHHYSDGSFHDWLSENAPGYSPLLEVQPVIVTINGLPLPPSMYHTVTSGRLAVKPRPQGYAAFFAIVIGLAIGLLMQPAALEANVGLPSGEQISQGGAKANTPKLGATVPDIAGRCRVYPDLLAPVRRRFIDDLAIEQRMRMCIGIGDYDIAPDDIFIGETRLSDIDGASYLIERPNEPNIGTGPQFYEIWHSAREVGSTSTMGGGIDLRNSSSRTFEAASVSRSFGLVSVGDTAPTRRISGSLPGDWVVNDIIRIEKYQNLNFTSHNTFQADAPWILDHAAADWVEIMGGPNAGRYVVVGAVSPGTFTVAKPGYPSPGFSTGTFSCAVGFDGLLYRIAAINAGNFLVWMRRDGIDLAGWAGWSAHTASSVISLVDDEGSSWAGPFACCPIGDVVTDIEVDLFFPRGLYRGQLSSMSVRVDVQFREFGTASWTQISKTIARATTNQVGLTVEIPTLSGRYEVRIRRVGQELPSNGADRVQWSALRGKLSNVYDYDGITTLSVVIPDVSQISARSENGVNVIATRMIPRINASGTGWLASAATREPCDYAAYIAKSVGYSDAQIDLLSLSLAKLAHSGATFDFSNSETTVFEALQAALAPAWGEPTIRGGLVCAVYDSLAIYQDGVWAGRQMFSAQNMTAPLRAAVRMPHADDHDGVEVEFLDGTTWTPETIRAYDPSFGAPLRLKKIKAVGITDRLRVGRLAWREFNKILFRRWDYSWSTELDALNCGYLDQVLIADEQPGIGGQQSALVRSITAGSPTVVVLTEPIAIEGRKLRLRSSVGADFDEVFAISAGPDLYTAHIAGTPTIWGWSDGMEAVHAVVSDDQPSRERVIITSIRPTQGGVDIDAIGYDVRVYEKDTSISIPDLP